MSWSLIKKEEYPGFFKGTLGTLVVCFGIWYLHPTADKTDSRSLAPQLACLSPAKELITLELAEDILDSEPVRKKVKPNDQPVKTSQGTSEGETEPTTGTDTGTNGTTYIELPYTGPEIIHGPDIVEPEKPIDGTKEGDVVTNVITVPFVGTSTVTPDISTERDADIISTITTTEESQNSTNGALRIKIERKFKAS